MFAEWLLDAFSKTWTVLTILVKKTSALQGLI